MARLTRRDGAGGHRRRELPRRRLARAADRRARLHRRQRPDRQVRGTRRRPRALPGASSQAGLTLQIGCQVGETSQLSAAQMVLVRALGQGVSTLEGCYGERLLAARSGATAAAVWPGRPPARTPRRDPDSAPKSTCSPSSVTPAAGSSSAPLRQGARLVRLALPAGGPMTIKAKLLFDVIGPPTLSRFDARCEHPMAEQEKLLRALLARERRHRVRPPPRLRRRSNRSAASRSRSRSRSTRTSSPTSKPLARASPRS